MARPIIAALALTLSACANPAPAPQPVMALIGYDCANGPRVQMRNNEDEFPAPCRAIERAYGLIVVTPLGDEYVIDYNLSATDCTRALTRSPGAYCAVQPE